MTLRFKMHWHIMVKHKNNAKTGLTCSLLVMTKICHLLVALANSFDPDQAQQTLEWYF